MFLFKLNFLTNLSWVSVWCFPEYEINGNHIRLGLVLHHVNIFFNISGAFDYENVL